MMNAATPATTALPYVVPREPNSSGRYLVYRSGGGSPVLWMAEVDEVVDFIIEKDDDVIKDPEGNVLDWDEEARRVVETYGLQPDPEVGRAAMAAFWREVLEQAARV